MQQGERFARHGMRRHDEQQRSGNGQQHAHHAHCAPQADAEQHHHGQYTGCSQFAGLHQITAKHVLRGLVHVDEQGGGLCIGAGQTLFGLPGGQGGFHLRLNRRGRLLRGVQREQGHVRGPVGQHQCVEPQRKAGAGQVGAGDGWVLARGLGIDQKRRQGLRLKGHLGEGLGEVGLQRGWLGDAGQALCLRDLAGQEARRCIQPRQGAAGLQWLQFGLQRLGARQGLLGCVAAHGEQPTQVVGAQIGAELCVERLQRAWHRVQAIEAA